MAAKGKATGVAKENSEDDCTSARLSWKDLTVGVNNGRKILHQMSGVAEPGRVLALMGPSGAGKTTLLDALSGRLSGSATVGGEILLNGRRTQMSYGTIAYMSQEVQLLGTLTVYETVYYSAKLRFPDRMTDEETRRIVNNSIADVGLTGCIHTVIGNWHMRGVSGGEKRRVSIAIELLTSPRILFLDEPTSGLDSASAYHVMKTLKKLKRNGRTVLCSIHQPGSEVFHLLDDLCLLSGGQQVYFGPLANALEFFENAGFPCPPLRSPFDHYLICVNTDFVEVENNLNPDLKDSHFGQNSEHPTPSDSPKMKRSAATLRRLTQSYATSKEKESVDAIIHHLSSSDYEPLPQTGSQSSFIRQCQFLTRRSFVNMSRDLAYYWVRLIIYIFLCVAVGSVYYKAGQSFKSIQARVGCVAFMVAFAAFLSVVGLQSFIDDIKVFTMERLNGHYGVGAFVVGNILSSVPFLFLISVVSSSITYFMVDLHHGAEHFFYFVLSLFALLLVAESLMMVVSSMVPNFLMVVIIAAGIQGIFILVAGFYRLPDDLPKAFWRYPMFYIAFHSYCFQGLMENDFKGLTFQNQNPKDPRLTGDYILQTSYQVQLDRSKWWNLAILFLMVVGYRMLFYVLIRARETNCPTCRTFITGKYCATTVEVEGADLDEKSGPNIDATVP